MESSVETYDRCFARIDFFFLLTGRRLSADKPRYLLISLLSNYTVYMTFPIACFFVFMLTMHHENIFYTIQQLWGLLALIQTILQIITRHVNWEEKDKIIQWARDIHLRKPSPEYNAIFNVHLKRTNDQLGLTLK